MFPAWVEQQWRKALAPIEIEEAREPNVQRASDPRDAWRRLTLFFESHRNLREHLQRFGGFRPGAGQCEDIAACLRQGREWFSVAAASGLMAKPVAIYYGMVSLAAAAAVAWGRPRRLEHLERGHGLKAVDVKSIGDARVCSQGPSLFQDFSQLLLERECAGVVIEASGAVRTGWLKLRLRETWRLEPFNASLTDLLARIVNLRELFRTTTGTEPPIVAVRHLYLDHPPFRNTSDPPWLPLATLVFEDERLLEQAWLLGTFPILSKWRRQEVSFSPGQPPPADRTPPNRQPAFDNLPLGFDQQAVDAGGARAAQAPRHGPPRGRRLQTPQAVPQVRGPSGDDPKLVRLAAARPLAGLLQPFARDNFGRQHLVAPLGTAETPLPQGSLMMAAALLLSSIARYRPEIWARFVSMQGNHPDSRFRALVEEFFLLCESWFPGYALSLLMREEIEVRSDRPSLRG